MFKSNKQNKGVVLCLITKIPKKKNVIQHFKISIEIFGISKTCLKLINKTRMLF